MKVEKEERSRRVEVTVFQGGGQSVRSTLLLSTTYTHQVTMISHAGYLDTWNHHAYIDMINIIGSSSNNTLSPLIFH